MKSLPGDRRIQHTPPKLAAFSPSYQKLVLGQIRDLIDGQKQDLEELVDLVEVGAHKLSEEYGKRIAEKIRVTVFSALDSAIKELAKDSKLQNPKAKVDMIAGLYRMLLPWQEQKGESVDPLEAYARSQRGERGYEWEYSDALARELPGKREVPVPTGFIDVLTKTEVIEVKHVSAWKHAVGQLQMYGLYYPLHKKRVHLFGAVDSMRLNSITQWCDQVAIKTTWEK